MTTPSTILSRSTEFSRSPTPNSSGSFQPPLLLQYNVCPSTIPIAGYTVPAEIIIRNGKSVSISPAKTFAPVKAQPPSIKLNWNVIPGKTILKYILTIASSGKSRAIELSNTLSTYIFSNLKCGNDYTFTIQMVFSDITNDIYRFVSPSSPTFMRTSNTIGINWSVPTVPTGLAVTYVSSNLRLHETTFCASWLHGMPSSDKNVASRPSILNYTLTITTITNDVKTSTQYTTETPSFDNIICKVGSQYILSVYSTNLIGDSHSETLAINWTVPNPPSNIKLTKSEILKDPVISWEPGPMIPNQQYITSYQIIITNIDTCDCTKLTAYVPVTSIPFAAELGHTYEISMVAVNLVGSSDKSIPYTILWEPYGDSVTIVDESVPETTLRSQISMSNREISWLTNLQPLTDYSIFVSTVVNGRTIRTTYTSTTTSLPFIPTLGNTYTIYVIANKFASPTFGASRLFALRSQAQRGEPLGYYVPDESTAQRCVGERLNSVAFGTEAKEFKSIWITLSAPTTVAISKSGTITWNPGTVVLNVPPLISYNVNVADKIIATNITTNLPQIFGLLLQTYSFIPETGHSYSVRISAVNGAGTSPLSVAAIL
jgi:hypothetical protein